MIDQEAVEIFAAKVDVFAESLSTDEQSLLAHLIKDDSEVEGYEFASAWPGLKVLAPIKLGDKIHTSAEPNDIFRPAPDPSAQTDRR